MTPTLSQFLKLMLWMHWRTLIARLAGIRNQSRLLLTILVGFVIGYLLVGYFLFFKGLEYVYQFPVVGTLLSFRLLYLIFGFFLIMLVVSNVITGYSTLFKNRETAWMLTMPVIHKHLYLWKFFEATLVSSWALIFLSAPLMAAYGRVHNVEWQFYLWMPIIYLPFIVIPSVVGAWCILLIARVLSRPWVKKALLLLAAVMIAVLVLNVDPTSEDDAMSVEDVVTFEKLLQHTRPTLNPVLPSVWFSRGIVALTQELHREWIFYTLLLTSNALFGLLLSYEIASRFFYPSWTYTASNRTWMFQRKENRLRQNKPRRPGLLERLLAKAPFPTRPMKALIVKDSKVFWRDPSQWTQFVVFFGLLMIYILNLRNVAYDFENPFWSTVISYLNLAACSLTLSTLTTRFVFPQFSLEGRRLWIIGLAPIGLKKVIQQKFHTSCVASITITVALMVTSCVTLNYELGRIIFFACAIALMSLSLSGLATELGAIFPNLREDDPSKIVSGFGGTLCLVISFVYIVLFITLLALPETLNLAASDRVFGFADIGKIAILCYLGALALSLATTIIPLRMAFREVKELEA